jgi:hypothetical protein
MKLLISLQSIVLVIIFAATAAAAARDDAVGYNLRQQQEQDKRMSSLAELIIKVDSGINSNDLEVDKHSGFLEALSDWISRRLWMTVTDHVVKITSNVPVLLEVEESSDMIVEEDQDHPDDYSLINTLANVLPLYPISSPLISAPTGLGYEDSSVAFTSNTGVFADSNKEGRILQTCAPIGSGCSFIRDCCSKLCFFLCIMIRLTLC